MAARFLFRLTLVSVLSLIVRGQANPLFPGINAGEKSEEFNGRSTSNENVLFFNRLPLTNWGDDSPHILQQAGVGKEKASGSGLPVVRLVSPRSTGNQYYIPVANKRGGKVILVDVVDYISKEKGQGDDGVPTVVLSGKGGGGISGNMMRFSGKR